MLWMQSLSSNHLLIYLMAATLARIATGASTVAIVLLANTFGAEGKIVGILAACITAPHLFGPIYGRWLDSSQRPRLILATACLLFTLCFLLSLYGFQTTLLWLAICALLICGICSAFMMGGLSTQLAGLIENDTASQRRAQSHDTLTYGFGLTVGPLIVALLSTNYSIETTVGLVMSLPLLAGILILFLPQYSAQSKEQHDIHFGFKQVLQAIQQSKPLIRTLAMTSGASFSAAALPIMAVYFSDMWQQDKESGAYLVTSYGLGCVCGALLLMIKPLKADAITLLRNVGIWLLGTLILVAISPNFHSGLVAYWLCGVVNSVFFATTLAARREYAPRQGAAQIYMWVAAAKITAASCGAFVAGLLLEQSLSLPMIVSICALAITLVICFLPYKLDNKLS
mgnify:CR=1 FL=1